MYHLTNDGAVTVIAGQITFLQIQFSFGAFETGLLSGAALLDRHLSDGLRRDVGSSGPDAVPPARDRRSRTRLRLGCPVLDLLDLAPARLPLPNRSEFLSPGRDRLDWPRVRGAGARSVDGVPVGLRRHRRHLRDGDYLRHRGGV